MTQRPLRWPIWARSSSATACFLNSPTSKRPRSWHRTSSGCGVWERGAGITRACGSGACATLVAAHRRGLTGRRADVVVDGGRLGIEWLKDDHVLMSGPVAISFFGTLDLARLA